MTKRRKKQSKTKPLRKAMDLKGEAWAVEDHLVDLAMVMGKVHLEASLETRHLLVLQISLATMKTSVTTLSLKVKILAYLTDTTNTKTQ